jgi:hypothetical protein
MINFEVCMRIYAKFHEMFFIVMHKSITRTKSSWIVLSSMAKAQSFWGVDLYYVRSMAVFTTSDIHHGDHLWREHCIVFMLTSHQWTSVGWVLVIEFWSHQTSLLAICWDCSTLSFDYGSKPQYELSNLIFTLYVFKNFVIINSCFNLGA